MIQAVPEYGMSDEGESSVGVDLTLTEADPAFRGAQDFSVDHGTMIWPIGHS